jgi:hypothetical protein
VNVLLPSRSSSSLALLTQVRRLMKEAQQAMKTKDDEISLLPDEDDIMKSLRLSRLPPDDAALCGSGGAPLSRALQIRPSRVGSSTWKSSSPRATPTPRPLSAPGLLCSTLTSTSRSLPCPPPTSLVAEPWVRTAERGDLPRHIEDGVDASVEHRVSVQVSEPPVVGTVTPTVTLGVAGQSSAFWGTQRLRAHLTVTQGT